MAEGTRFKTLEADLHQLQTDQVQTRTTVEQLASSQARQEKMLAEVLQQLGRLPLKGRSDSDSDVDRKTEHEGFSILGCHKPAPVLQPRFSGANPERWVAQASRYFDFYSIPDADRLTISSFYLDDVASDWYDWLQCHHLLTTWEEFTIALQKRFRSPDLEEPEGQLAKLQQTSTVSEYRNKFEEISNRLILLPRAFLVSCFISGLRPDIKQSVLVHKPQTLDDAMEYALKHEQRLLLEKGVGRVSLGSSKGLLPTPKTTTSTTSSVSPAQLKSLPPNIGFRKLSPAEIATKRSQGLCFKCDEKYSWDHKCKAGPQLLFFDDDPPDSDSSLASLISTVSDGTIAESLQMEEAKLTPLSLIMHCPILLDGGSTHSLVQTRVVHFLGLTIESISPFSVLVGSGERLQCAGIAKQVVVEIQNKTITIDLFVLPLQGWDMVLGASWLATLGPVITDYKLGTFEFQSEGKRICWQGDSSPVIQPIQFHGFQQLLHTQSIGQLFHLQLIHPSSPVCSAIPPDLQALLDQFSTVFQPPQGLPPTRAKDHGITLLPMSKLVSVRPYRYPHFQKQEIERLVAEMLAQGIIRPSTSAFSSPVLLVKKKDGTWRFCVDYRALNAITVRDRFPIPSIDELFDELYNAKVFSKLDLLAGYHQIRVAQDDISKTAFRTHDGHFEFLVMPFGLTNAPSTFQRLMNDVFRPHLRKFILVFFDDILVYSPSWSDHLQHLALTLQLLRDHHLVAKMSKCVFGQSQVAYLGHIISAQGVSVDPSKIDAILQWPTPSSVKDVRAFLGLTGYYRRFIRHYATIAGPLTDLLCKDAFTWNETTHSAFTTLKQLLGSTPVLRLPDFSKPFFIETDASGVGIGAILSQDKHPLAYYSKKLCPRMQQASTYHREMYAITQAISKWRQYLLGNKFTILTDQQSLKNLQHQVIQTPEQQKWLGKLLGFDFDILYRPGKLNTAADALSRMPDSQLLALSSQEPSLLKDIHRANLSDSEAQTIIHQLTNAPSSAPFQLRDGLLFYNNRLFVPATSNLRSQLLLEFHASMVGGHAGVNRTFHRLSSNFYWPRMRAAVSQFIAECQASAQMTPFEIVYGRKPPTIHRYIRDATTNAALEQQLLDRDNILAILKINLAKAQTPRIHPVFHVSLLRKCLGQPTQQVTPLHLVDSTTTMLLLPQQILDHRTIIRSGQTVAQSLVQWDGLPSIEATWEDDCLLRLKFPEFHLADKVTLDGDGTVMDTGSAHLRRSQQVRQPSRRMQGYAWKDTSAPDPTNS
ncbi:uncharacterized protein LOC110906345 [Helianthus annuus]|uniref:uncharacterized protein LOC110906345 n=1 Tax=Helianthus annuus TaxID=4232 RepID=UPI000B8EF6BA|nr:uncharacterized protein LOC110906345 [Helianthus annuus]